MEPQFQGPPQKVQQSAQQGQPVQPYPQAQGQAPPAYTQQAVYTQQPVGQPQQQVVMMQPMAGNPMPGQRIQQQVVMVPPPQAIPGCPPGLEYLAAVDQLLVHQQIELLEALTGFETENKYLIKNALGQQVYYAAEKSDCCARNCIGASRCFEMSILDNAGNVVMQIDRPFRCTNPWQPFLLPVNACFLQIMTIRDRDGQDMGRVKQSYHVFLPRFVVLDNEDNEVCRIQGPFCRIPCLGDINFELFQGENKIGVISKQWSGLAQEMFTDADNFGVTWPMAMPPLHKALILAAVFLIDFVYFEESQNNNNMR